MGSLKEIHRRISPSCPCVHSLGSCLSLCPVVPFYKDTSPIELVFTLINSYILKHLCSDPVSKFSHILRSNLLLVLCLSSILTTSVGLLQPRCSMSEILISFPSFHEHRVRTLTPNYHHLDSISVVSPVGPVLFALQTLLQTFSGSCYLDDYGKSTNDCRLFVTSQTLH
jgi:hypothetical protein